MSEKTKYNGMVYYDLGEAIAAADHKAKVRQGPAYVYDCVICMNTEMYMVLTHEGTYGDLIYKTEYLD